MASTNNNNRQLETKTMSNSELSALVGTTHAFPLHLIDIDASANPRPLKLSHVKELAEDFVSRFDKGQTVQLQEVVVIPHPDANSPQPLKLALGFHRGHGFALANAMLTERGLPELPVRAHVMTADDAAQLITDNFTENATHMGIDPIAQLGYIKALKALGKTQVEIAARLKVSTAQITQRLKLDLLSDEIKAKVASGEIPVVAALAMVAMDDGQQAKAVKALDDINAAVADPNRVGGIRVPKVAVVAAAAGVDANAGGDSNTGDANPSVNQASALKRGLGALLRVAKVVNRLKILPSGVSNIIDITVAAIEGGSADQPGFLRELAGAAIKTEGTVPKAAALGKELTAVFAEVDAEEQAEANAEKEQKAQAAAEAKAAKDAEKAKEREAAKAQAQADKEAKAQVAKAEKEAKAQAEKNAKEAEKAQKAQAQADAKAKAAAEKEAKAQAAAQAKEAEKAAAAKLKADKAAQAAKVAQQKAEKAQADAAAKGNGTTGATATATAAPATPAPGSKKPKGLPAGVATAAAAVTTPATKQPRGLAKPAQTA